MSGQTTKGGRAVLDTSKANQRRLGQYRELLRIRVTPAEERIKALLTDLREPFIFQKGFYCPHSFVIVDFYLKHRNKLCLEVDGPYHERQLSYDAARDDYLEKVRGFRVLHITNRLALSIRPDELLGLIKFFPRGHFSTPNAMEGFVFLPIPSNLR